MDGFRNGFDLGYRGPNEVQFRSPNLKFTVGSKVILWNKVMKEVENKRYAGPYKKIPFENFIQSPIGLVPKDKNKTRLIFHLSFPRKTGKSVNENTPEYLSKVKYKDFDMAVKICLRKGSKRLFGGKSDMTSAFRHCPINKKYWKYLVMKAQSPIDNEWYYFVDKCLPFGASISCAVFQAFSDAISHIVKVKSGGQDNVNYLDDFLFIAILKRMCNWQLDLFLQTCQEVRFPVSLEKTFRAQRRIVFLGLLLDLLHGRVCIPVEKLQRARDAIQKMLSNKKNKTTLRELQQLCGFLNFLSKAIIPGRTFTRRLYAYGDGYLKPHHHLPVNKEMKMDLRLWEKFLESEENYSRPFFEFDNCVTYTPVDFFTDASRNQLLGCGGVCDQEWFILQWNEKFIEREQPSIAYLELYALTVGIINWIGKYRNRKVCIFCDNQSVINMVNKMTSKCRNCMVLIRMIVLLSLQNNVKIKVLYIESKRNTLADLLSRMKYGQFRKQARIEGKTFNQKPTPIPEILDPIEKLWLPIEKKKKQKKTKSKCKQINHTDNQFQGKRKGKEQLTGRPNQLRQHEYPRTL